MEFEIMIMSFDLLLNNCVNLNFVVGFVMQFISLMIKFMESSIGFFISVEILFAIVGFHLKNWKEFKNWIKITFFLLDSQYWFMRLWNFYSWQIKSIAMLIWLYKFLKSLSFNWNRKIIIVQQYVFNNQIENTLFYQSLFWQYYQTKVSTCII